jgi:NAD+ kinase
VVVHPSRDVAIPLASITDWAAGRGVEVVQVVVRAHEPRIAPLAAPEEVDVVVAIGGDGTVLGALHAAAPAGRPVLGVAWGSLGALATVGPQDVEAALDAFGAGDWTARELPSVHVEANGGRSADALNDVVVVRDGAGQVAISLSLDGTLYARFGGDGIIVSTPVGSSAYALAAGGPLLAPGAQALLATPLAPHAGSAPPLVAGAGSRLTIVAEAGYGGARVEVDGQGLELGTLSFEASLRPAYATLVTLPGEEALLTGLRRRGIIADGPRVLARDAREAEDARAAGT